MGCTPLSFIISVLALCCAGVIMGFSAYVINETTFLFTSSWTVYFAVSVGAINLLLLFVTSLLGCFGCCGRVITGTLSTVRLVLELLALALFVAVAIAAQVELEGVKISQLTDTCDDFGIACAWGISIILMWSAVGLLAVGCVIHLASCCSCCCGGGKAGGEGDE